MATSKPKPKPNGTTLKRKREAEAPSIPHTSKFRKNPNKRTKTGAKSNKKSDNNNDNNNNNNNNKKVKQTENTEKEAEAEPTEEAAPTEEPAPIEGAEPAEEAEDSQTEFEAIAIIGEKRGKYRIQWGGIDPKTGKAYKPTWEPKAYANAALLAYYKEKNAEKAAEAKKARAKKRAATRRKNSSFVVPDDSSSLPAASPPAAEEAPTTAPSPATSSPPAAGPTRPSPTPSSSSSSPSTPAAIDPTPQSPPPSSSPVARTANPPPQQPEPYVQVTQQSDFDPSAYERFSQVAPTQTVDDDDSSSAVHEASEPPSSPAQPVLPRKLQFPSSAIVPDSQSLPDSHDYVPSTQTTSGLSEFQTGESQQVDLQPSSLSIAQTAGQFLEEIDTGSFVQSATAEESTAPSQFASHSNTDIQLFDQEQRAQVIYSDSNFSTQDEISQSVRPTIEDPLYHQADTPEPHRFGEDSTLSSPAPPRPSGASQRSDDSRDNLDSKSPEDIARPSMPEPEGSDIFQQPAAPPKPKDQAVLRDLGQSRLLAESASGPSTRSPSAIPDRAPKSQVPTSLRTNTLADSTSQYSAPVPNMATDNASEVDLDHSRLEDDIELSPNEFIIPITAEGRQKQRYLDEIQRKAATVKHFIEAPVPASISADISELVERLRAVEVHVDLLDYETTDPTYKITPSLQIEWDMRNSAKLRFLGEFLGIIRDSGRHVVLVVDNMRNMLIQMLERFLDGNHIGWQNPEAQRTSTPSWARGTISVTLMAKDSNAVIDKAVDLVICLDGCLNATQIRDRGWGPAPIFYPMIPASTQHIDRCLSPYLSSTQRMHALVTCMGQLRTDFGSVINPTDSASEAARTAAWWFNGMCAGGHEEYDWPLAPISSLKDVVDYASTQASQGGVKRQLDAPELEPAKRFRFTPQPQPKSTQGDVTHISDSFMPTLEDLARPSRQVERREIPVTDAKALSKHHEREMSRLHHVMDQRQTDYEALFKRNKQLQSQLVEAKSQAEAYIHERDMANDRFKLKCTEFDSLSAKLQELQTAALASDDEKLATIAKFQQALAASKAAEARAVKKADTAEQHNGYLTEQYQNASRRATDLTGINEALVKERDEYKKKAEGHKEHFQLEFYKSSQTSLLAQVKGLKNELHLAKGLATRKEEELRALKAAKGVSMGTRAASVPRSPRVGGNAGSRAASPLPGGRVGLLRNG